LLFYLSTYLSIASICPYYLPTHSLPSPHTTEIFIGSVLATKLAVWIDDIEKKEQGGLEMTKKAEGKEGGEWVKVETGLYGGEGEEEEEEEEEDDEMCGPPT
jgi:hypothetical protein